MCFHLGQQLGGWEYYGRLGTVFFLRGGRGRGGSQRLIIKKKMVENVSAPKIVENVRAMSSPPETPSSGRADTPNEATLLAQCSLSRKRKADQEECFPVDFISKGLD